MYAEETKFYPFKNKDENNNNNKNAFNILMETSKQKNEDFNNNIFDAINNILEIRYLK